CNGKPDPKGHAQIIKKPQSGENKIQRPGIIPIKTASPNRQNKKIIYLYFKITSMKKFILPIICAFLSFALSGCGLVEGAFKAGLIFGLIIIAVIGLIIYLLRIVIKQLIKTPIFKNIQPKI
ncbi:MAG: hypothetical protein EOP42_21400, partial [Sphingobacteriaceae bacterium]